MNVAWDCDDLGQFQQLVTRYRQLLAEHGALNRPFKDLLTLQHLTHTRADAEAPGSHLLD